jgi:DnaJ-class molecular chaperone
MKTTCEACNGTTFCPACNGYGRELVEHLVSPCPECHGYGIVGRRETRHWCRSCGGSGRTLTYGPLLVECELCGGDGACGECEGSL